MTEPVPVADSPHHVCRTCHAVFRQAFKRCPLDGSELERSHEDPLVGITLAERYMIAECIGEGGMGRVYRAQHTRMSRQFAIKVLFGDLAADTVNRRRFEREAEAASRLQHPNLIAVTDFGNTAGGLLYLVMEFIAGANLRALIDAEAPFDTDRTAHLLRQLASGLDHAHSRGLVHRDFKPDNVHVIAGDDGEVVKILDFGIARLVEQGGGKKLTTDGMVMGTPAFMSPEQATGKGVDHRTDLFSLGLVLYEMATGRLPFDGEPMDILTQNLTLTPPPLSERAGFAVESNLESIAAQLVAKNPDQRFQRARDVVEAIDAWWAPPRTRRASGSGLRGSGRMSQPRVVLPGPDGDYGDDYIGDEDTRADANLHESSSFGFEPTEAGFGHSDQVAQVGADADRTGANAAAADLVSGAARGPGTPSATESAKTLALAAAVDYPRAGNVHRRAGEARAHAGSESQTAESEPIGAAGAASAAKSEVGSISVGQAVTSPGLTVGLASASAQASAPLAVERVATQPSQPTEFGRRGHRSIGNLLAVLGLIALTVTGAVLLFTGEPADTALGDDEPGQTEPGPALTGAPAVTPPQVPVGSEVGADSDPADTDQGPSQAQEPERPAATPSADAAGDPSAEPTGDTVLASATVSADGSDGTEGADGNEGTDGNEVTSPPAPNAGAAADTDRRRTRSGPGRSGRAEARNRPSAAQTSRNASNASAAQTSRNASNASAATTAGAANARAEQSADQAITPEQYRDRYKGLLKRYQTLFESLPQGSPLAAKVSALSEDLGLLPYAPSGDALVGANRKLVQLERKLRRLERDANRAR